MVHESRVRKMFKTLRCVTIVDMFSPEKSQSAQQKVSSLEKGLEQVDFEMIRDICARILRKAGVDEKKAEKISLDIVNKKGGNFTNYLSGTKAYYDPTDVNVTFVKPFIPSRIQRFTNILVHELVHAISDSNENNPENDEDYKSNLGLEAQEFDGKLFGFYYYKNSYILLNEGITELVAEAITHEYFRRKGEAVEDISLTERNFYLSGKAVVELLAKSIAYRTGVPENVAFKAITRCMLNYDFDEFVKLTEEDLVLKELLQKIKDLGKFTLETNRLLSQVKLAERGVDLSSLKVDGLEDVFDNILIGRIRPADKKDTMEGHYFNPLYGDLL